MGIDFQKNNVFCTNAPLTRARHNPHILDCAHWPPNLISQKVFAQPLGKSQSLHRYVNSFFILEIMKDKLTDLCKNWLFRNFFMNTFCEIQPRRVWACMPRQSPARGSQKSTSRKGLGVPKVNTVHTLVPKRTRPSGRLISQNAFINSFCEVNSPQNRGLIVYYY